MFENGLYDYINRSLNSIAPTVSLNEITIIPYLLSTSYLYELLQSHSAISSDNGYLKTKSNLD